MIDAKHVARLYAEGLSLREIGRRLGCTHENARYLARRDGLTMASRGGVLPPISDLAVEIHDDLDDGDLMNGATLAGLVDWLGETPQAIKAALGELLSRGWIKFDGYVYEACLPPATSRPEREEAA